MYIIPDKYREELVQYRELVKKALRKDVDEVRFKIFRVVRGVYEQRTKGTFMVRIRCAGGTISPIQLIKVAEISQNYNSSTIHITTRQEIQLHNVKLENTPDILEELYKVGLSTKGSGGNTVRNITASIESGISIDDEFDVTPYNIALTNFLIGYDKSFDLPRKLKIAFSSSDRDSALAGFNDLGFMAKIKNGEKGFKVFIGGSPSVKPMVGEVLFDFLPADRIFNVSLAVIEMFNEHGNRKNRHKARLRYLFYKIGKEKVFELFNETYNQFKNLKFEPINEFMPDLTVTDDKKLESRKWPGKHIEKWIDDYVVNQKQKNLYSVEIPVMHGNLTAAQAKTIAGFANYFGNNTIRFSRRQNIHLRNIPETYLGTLYDTIKDAGLEISKPFILGNLVSCTGADTCQLGICFSKGGLQAIHDKLAINHDLHNLKKLDVNISGCPNSCGQHLVADLGFAGRVSRKGRIYPSYTIFAGAYIGNDKACLPIHIGEVAARDLPEFTNDILSLYRQKPAYLTFREFVEHEKEEIQAIINNYKQIPAYEENRKYYIDWGNNDMFSLEKRGGGECSVGLLDLIESEIKILKKCKESFLGQQEVEEKTVLLHEMVLSASKLLCLSFQGPICDEKLLFETIEKKIISKGVLPEIYLDIFKYVADGNFTALIKQKNVVLDYVDKSIVYYQNLDDSLQVKMEVKEITAIELKDMMDKKAGIKIIDVRESWEKEIADIGGELIPLGSIDDNLEKIPENKPTIVYCRTGRRSAEAITHLAKSRKTDNLLNLKGGIHAWAEEIDVNIQKY